jgi:hypothetical protein
VLVHLKDLYSLVRGHTEEKDRIPDNEIIRFCAQEARALANLRPLAQPLPAKVRPLSRTLAISVTPQPRWPWCPPPGRPSRPTRPGAWPTC